MCIDVYICICVRLRVMCVCPCSCKCSCIFAHRCPRDPNKKRKKERKEKKKSTPKRQHAKKEKNTTTKQHKKQTRPGRSSTTPNDPQRPHKCEIQHGTISRTTITRAVSPCNRQLHLGKLGQSKSFIRAIASCQSPLFCGVAPRTYCNMNIA